MIGNRSVSGRAQTAAQLDAGDARQHPVEDQQIRNPLLKCNFSLVTAQHGVDLVAFSFQIVAKQHRKRLFVLNHSNTWTHRHGSCTP